MPTIPVTRSCGRYGRLRTTYRARRWKYSRRDQFVSIPRFDEWNFVAVAERCEGPAGGTVAKSICSTSIAMIQSKSSDGTNNHFNWLRLPRQCTHRAFTIDPMPDAFHGLNGSVPIFLVFFTGTLLLLRSNLSSIFTSVFVPRKFFRSIST